MKNVTTTLFSISLLAIFFTNYHASTGAGIAKTKVYGTCQCEGATPTASKVELTLNADQTFHYQNSSVPAKKVDISGNWSVNGKKIVLEAANNFRQNWKFDKNQSCVVTRKGLEFIRLCDIESCK
jgi:predicted transcriptional regulator